MNKTLSEQDASASPKSATVIGLGNIGSFVSGLLARTPGVERITLLDRDAYELKNSTSQDINTDDVGRPKAAVQAERLRRINPTLRITAIAEDLETAPLGRLRAEVILGCLDSLRARQSLNQAAWRLGIPWIDSGVRADQMLARVNVYRPALGEPCLECGWEQRDYDRLEQTYPCTGDAPLPAPTNAPASLGALAAALQVIECQKIFAQNWDRVAAGRQVLIDSISHRLFVTSFRHNVHCRFDHEIFHIDRLPQLAGTLTIGDALALAGRVASVSGAAIRVEGQVFVRQLVCRCGAVKALSWRLSGRLGADQQCSRCRRRMFAPGTEVREWLAECDLPPAALAEPLAGFGFRAADVFTVRGFDGDRHVELGESESENDTVANAAAQQPAGTCG